MHSSTCSSSSFSFLTFDFCSCSTDNRPTHELTAASAPRPRQSAQVQYLYSQPGHTFAYSHPAALLDPYLAAAPALPAASGPSNQFSRLTQLPPNPQFDRSRAAARPSTSTSTRTRTRSAASLTRTSNSFAAAPTRQWSPVYSTLGK